MRIVGALLMVGGVICFFMSSYQLWELQFEVNERLPQDQQLEPVFWSFGTRRKLRELQKQVLPKSSRVRRSVRFAVGGFCSFFPGVALFLANLH